MGCPIEGDIAYCGVSDLVRTIKPGGGLRDPLVLIESRRVRGGVADTLFAGGTIWRGW